MNIRTFISIVISVLTALAVSTAAFAENTATPADADMISTAEVTITADVKEDGEDVDIVREEVSLDISESGNGIQIDTDEVSIDEKGNKDGIVVDYADTYTDIPFTGSGKAIGFAALAIICSGIIATLEYRKHKSLGKK